MAATFDQVLKSFVLSAEQFVKNPSNDRNRQQLERRTGAILKTVQSPDSKLDVLVNSISKTNSVLLSESFAYLLNVLGVPTKKTGLHLCVLDAILALIRNDGVRDKLLESFNVVPSLVSFIALCQQTQETTDGGGVCEEVLVKCLEVTQFITYGSRLSYPEPFTDKLLNYAMQEILNGKHHRVTTLCIGILANICRRNLPVQGHIKGMEISGKLQRALLGYLTSDNMTKIICSVSVITSLYLNDEYGSKLFNAENINQTFQFMFNVLINGVDIITVNIAADLFTDLAGNDKIQNYLLVYEHISECFTQTLLILAKDDERRIAKVLTLFNAFCRNSGLCKIVARCVFDYQYAPELMNTETEQPDLPTETHNPFQLLKFWAEKSAVRDKRWDVSSLSVNLFNNIYEVMIETGLFVTLDLKIDLITQSMLDSLCSIISHDDIPPSDDTLQGTCRKLLSIMKLFNLLSCDPQFKVNILQILLPETCIHLIDYLDNCNLTVLLNKPISSQPTWVFEGLRTVLTTLSTMLKLSQESGGPMLVELHNYLEDQMIVPYLSYVFTADMDRSYVHDGLSLYKEGVRLQGFPIDVLGEYIAARNSAKKVVSDNDFHHCSGGKVTTSIVCPPSPPQTTPVTECGDEVQGLVNRIQTSLELKDNVKISDIIDIYEQKVSDLSMKENHLQDLLNAKVMAVQQADRLIDQYKQDRKHMEIESKKLRIMLKESERKYEHCMDQFDRERGEKDELRVQLENVKLEVCRLENVTDDFTQLQIAFAEQNEQMESLQKKFTAHKKTYQSLLETVDTLSKHKESLDSQLEEVQSKSDQERKTLLKQIKEKDNRCLELQKSLKRSESQSFTIQKERDDLETANERLRVELENYKKLTAMINNLSSGSGNDPSGFDPVK